jgi:hypothetical protein
VSVQVCGGCTLVGGDVMCLIEKSRAAVAAISTGACTQMCVYVCVCVCCHIKKGQLCDSLLESMNFLYLVESQWYPVTGGASAIRLQYVLNVEHIIRVNHNRICTPYMTVCMVISLLKILYIHRLYVYMCGSGQPYT